MNKCVFVGRNAARTLRLLKTRLAKPERWSLSVYPSQDESPEAVVLTEDVLSVPADLLSPRLRLVQSTSPSPADPQARGVRGLPGSTVEFVFAHILRLSLAAEPRADLSQQSLGYIGHERTLIDSLQRAAYSFRMHFLSGVSPEATLRLCSHVVVGDRLGPPVTKQDLLGAKRGCHLIDMVGGLCRS